MSNFFSALGKAWDQTELFIGGLFLSVAVILITAEVACRNFFSWSIVGADEIACFAVIWSVFFTASLGVKRNIHVRIDILFTVLPRIVARWVDLLGTALSLLFTLYLTYSGWALVQESLMLGEITMTMLKLPVWVPQLIMPLGGLLLSVRFLQRLISLSTAAEETPAVGLGI
jgi:C4-dicarboxylate transporter DctQ subunit